MANKKTEEINRAAMEIILYAGNARELFVAALNSVEEKEFSNYQSLIDKAERETVKAHKIQTRIIQDAIEEDSPSLTVLLIHAQDTLMTVDCELRLVRRIIKLHEKLDKVERGESF